MLVFLITVVFVGALVMGGIALFKAISQVIEHVREHPEAGNSIFTHVILPVFGGRKESKRNARSEVADAHVSSTEGASAE